MQAAVGVEQLKKIPSFIESRKENWSFLREQLSSLAEDLILPEPADNADPSWFGFLISVKKGSVVKRDQLTAYLEEKNIQTRLLFSGNLIKHPCFDQIRNTDAYRVVGNLTEIDYIIENTFWIGVYPGMTKEMLSYIAKQIITGINALKY